MAHAPGPVREREMAGEDAARILSRAAKRFFARGKAAKESDEKLHPLRIAAKKLRYTLELLPQPVKCVEPIRKLQSRLGDINDFETIRRIVTEEGAGKRLAERLKQTRDNKIREFRLYWQAEFGGRNNARKWTHALRGAVKPSHRVEHSDWVEEVPHLFLLRP